MHRQVVTVANIPFSRAWDNVQPFFLHANNADFRSLTDRITLSKLGIFSIDHRRKVNAQQAEIARRAEIDDAYAFLGLDKRAEHQRIAREVQDAGVVPDGCWPTSTGAFTTRRDALDRETVAAAKRIRAAEVYAREIAEDHVVAAVHSLGA